ncbi:MAG: bifunctional DNA-formamidopyrimidine glycosylase/DNA-(apurinic or apyrimidinic site) lyase [Gammaproteobacteria bacterium]|nr:bifunctional DNA-formamidopyrimidine glycosylase/DNA-(apurinic or apyrimidinic site) lyase [Gammaproteobacteria bacterium]
MPELPEVETTRRGIEPHVLGRCVAGLAIRQRRLRWPIPRALDRALPGQIIRNVRRRAKYLLLDTDAGTAILHLGMSGSLRIVPSAAPAGKHDHVDIQLDSGQSLRLTDPRRFGALLWTTAPVEQHELLVDLGPEPLSDNFDGAHLFAAARNRKLAVKQFIMDSHIVVGVGNIYASEALFMAGIHPTRPAGRVSRERYEALAKAIKQVLAASIRMGGTTLRNFVGGDGRPGYFKQTLRVYDRLGEPCRQCGAPIRGKRIGQRSSFYCVNCQR